MNREGLFQAIALIVFGVFLILLPGPLFSLPLAVLILFAALGIFLAGEGFLRLREVLLPADRGIDQESKKPPFSSLLATMRLL